MKQGSVVPANRRDRESAPGRRAAGGRARCARAEAASFKDLAPSYADAICSRTNTEGHQDAHGPGAPLDIVAIEQIRVDVVVVDEMNRKPLGRPWMTAAIDVYSRMVAGLYLSLDAPSAHAVGACLSRAILPKEAYLADLQIEGKWPVWGFPRKVRLDNSGECQDAALVRACAQYSIGIEHSPVGMPTSRGPVEHLMDLAARELWRLPGAAAFNSPKGLKGSKSGPQATMTLRELEAHFVNFVVNSYHQRTHGALGMAPIRQWEIGLNGTPDRPGTGVPCKPSDPGQVRLDFLSPETLTGHRAPRR